LAEPASTREIARLAFPALGVLAAEPLYLLFDTAVVGRLGALALAGLAIGALFLGLVSSQGTFLSYGTTARSARHFGAGDRRAAVREGVTASWLAVALGVAIVAVVQIAAVPLTMAIAGSADIADAALGWLRIAIGGAPAILLSLAGNGWMRGVQDTRRPLHYVIAGFAVSAVLCPLLVYGLFGLPRLGLDGSAVANLVGQWLAALLFVRALVGERVPLAPDPGLLRANW
jgi:putative MATE family efflux protein